MPMSWLVLGVGVIMWILNGLGHLILGRSPTCGVEECRGIPDSGFKMDWSTGMLATQGGWVANANPIDTAYNMGNFAYVDADSQRLAPGARGWAQSQPGGVWQHLPLHRLRPCDGRRWRIWRLL